MEPNMGQILFDGTVAAIVCHLKDRGTFNQLGETDIERLVSVMKGLLLENLNEFWQDWQDAITCKAPEHILRGVVNLQCNKVAVDTIKQCGFWAKTNPS